MPSSAPNHGGGISLMAERWAVVPKTEVRFLYSAPL